MTVEKSSIEPGYSITRFIDQNHISLPGYDISKVSDELRKAFENNIV